MRYPSTCTVNKRGLARVETLSAGPKSRGGRGRHVQGGLPLPGSHTLPQDAGGGEQSCLAALPGRLVCRGEGLLGWGLAPHGSHMGPEGGLGSFLLSPKALAHLTHQGTDEDCHSKAAAVSLPGDGWRSGPPAKAPRLRSLVGRPGEARPGPHDGEAVCPALAPGSQGAAGGRRWGGGVPSAPAASRDRRPSPAPPAPLQPGGPGPLNSSHGLAEQVTPQLPRAGLDAVGAGDTVCRKTNFFVKD